MQKTLLPFLSKLIGFITLAFCLSNCQSEGSSKTADFTGEQLAQKYCASCHAFVSPELLPKNTWLMGVLPEMRARLLTYYNFEDDYLNYSKNLHKPLITSQDWQKIVNYFANSAPDSLTSFASAPVKTGLEYFIPYFINEGSDVPPHITMLKVNSLKKSIYICEGDKNQLLIFDRYGKKYDSLLVDSPITDLVFEGDELYLLTIGKMKPNDDSLGKLLRWRKGEVPQEVMNHLNRLVFMQLADLNQDGKKDMLIAEYGHEKGSLAWFEIGKEKPHKHVLNTYSGNLKSYLKDMNGDGWVDIVSLVAQMNEGIFTYYNQGDGKFREKNILTFLPVFGVTDFELIDWDNDGDWDILLTSGDNADYSVTLKNYHGFRIYLNDGKNNFIEKYFYPLNGAFKVRARDYDQDGDIDIALISFFPDYANLTNESFVYLKNKNSSNFSFEAGTFKEAIQGHWMVMETEDIDDDGDLDIVLGSFTSAPVAPPPHWTNLWKSKRYSFLLLENQYIK
ncbi:FG-GAP-like repeat-containing protein [Thermoflexibacter ruber]|uniref:Repeat domain-containing protein n=1 Tax=Thermoflexibacter ruber TaxID=1003 RepID=A0A1I2B3L9_9BACT|nr:VCBS repeat-containing protein [Thermoflexibacter ruber]SFE50686.1 Repeat domain-containing protein [Thermoflexibacter ruber]